MRHHLLKPDIRASGVPVASTWRRGIPRHQIVEPVDWMTFGNLRQSVAQVCLWVDAVELRGVDEGVDGCGPVTAGVRTCEEIILPAHGDAAHGVLGNVVVHLQPPVGDEPGQSLAAVDRIAECIRQGGFR